MAVQGVAEMMAARTIDWSESECAVLESVVDTLRPSPRHLRDILDWLDDIAARDGQRPGAVLREPGLARVLRARGSASDRLKRWKETLRRLRYPRLMARQAEAAELVRAMHLGPAVEVRLPPDLEGGAVTVAIAASSSDGLSDALTRLHARLRSGDVARLFALLDEV